MSTTPLKLITISVCFALSACGGGGGSSSTTGDGTTTLPEGDSQTGGGAPQNGKPSGNDTGNEQPTENEQPDTPLPPRIDLATARWEVTDLTDIMPKSSFPKDINDNGDIVGTESITQPIPGSELEMIVGTRMFVISKGQVIQARSDQLHTPISINNRGDIAAENYHWRSWLPNEPIVFTGEEIQVGHIPDISWPYIYKIAGMNNRGDLAGTANSTDRTTAVPFVANGGKIRYFELPEGWTKTNTRGINDRGQLTGCAVYVEGVPSHCITAYFYNGQTFETIGKIPSKSFTNPMAINNSGQIVGYNLNAEDGSGGRFRSFLYQDGKIEELSLPGAGSQTWGINDHGQIIGNIWWNPDSSTTGYVMDRGQVIDLSTVPDIVAAGYQILDTSAINNHGQILALAIKDNYMRHVLLTPVPPKSD